MDLDVCWMPSLHLEQETASTRGRSAAFIMVGAKSGGRFKPPAESRDVEWKYTNLA
jgi:hypothetical protein